MQGAGGYALQTATHQLDGENADQHDENSNANELGVITGRGKGGFNAGRQGRMRGGNRTGNQSTSSGEGTTSRFDHLHFDSPKKRPDEISGRWVNSAEQLKKILAEKAGGFDINMNHEYQKRHGWSQDAH
nr:hypothetical protein [Zoogloea sp.]